MMHIPALTIGNTVNYLTNLHTLGAQQVIIFPSKVAAPSPANVAKGRETTLVTPLLMRATFITINMAVRHVNNATLSHFAWLSLCHNRLWI